MFVIVLEFASTLLFSSPFLWSVFYLGKHFFPHWFRCAWILFGVCDNIAITISVFSCAVIITTVNRQYQTNNNIICAEIEAAARSQLQQTKMYFAVQVLYAGLTRARAYSYSHTSSRTYIFFMIICWRTKTIATNCVHREILRGAHSR